MQSEKEKGRCPAPHPSPSAIAAQGRATPASMRNALICVVVLRSPDNTIKGNRMINYNNGEEGDIGVTRHAMTERERE